MQHLVIVFLHVASAMGIVGSFGIESLVLTQLRAARTATDARTVLSSYRYSQRAGAASLIVTVVTGIYLATAYWGWRGAWMGSGFLTLVAIAIIGATMTGRAVTRLLRVDSVDRHPECDHADFRQQRRHGGDRRHLRGEHQHRCQQGPAPR